MRIINILFWLNIIFALIDLNTYFSTGDTSWLWCAGLCILGAAVSRSKD